MNIAALIAWLVTAIGGFYLLGTWLARGGVRQQQAGTTRFTAPVIFGHFLLAAAGLVVWIIYLVVGQTALAWAGFFILVPVALLGFTMFARWIGVYRAADGGDRGPAPGPGRPSMAAGNPLAATATAAAEAVPAERHLPAVVVVAHGLLAATTLVLVLLAAIGIGR
jgi:hypothetical protein